jgi:DNA-binding LacI/PurR family transcriptional regulator
VLLDRVEARNPFPTVAVDNRQAGRLGGEHLFAAGYRRIAFFGHSHDRWILNQRREGFLDAARAAGALDQCQFHELSLLPEEVHQSTLRILGGGNRPEAIFAASNIAAKGVIPAVQALGLRIPEDVALLVMDDFEALTLLNPGISAVAQPSEEIAAVGWRMLRQLIAGEEPAEPHVRLPAQLIIRGSTIRVAGRRAR